MMIEIYYIIGKIKGWYVVNSESDQNNYQLFYVIQALIFIP